MGLYESWLKVFQGASSKELTETLNKKYKQAADLQQVIRALETLKARKEGRLR